MPATYEPIATTTLGSASATVDFTSIPSTYTDLVLVFSGSTSSGNLGKLRFNSDTGSNYSCTILWATGSYKTSSRYTEPYLWVIPASANVMQNAIISINNYANANTYKTYLARANMPIESVGTTIGLWRNTNAITGIQFALSSGNYTSGSTFTLYGVKSA